MQFIADHHYGVEIVWWRVRKVVQDQPCSWHLLQQEL